MKTPLTKRIPRELRANWSRYTGMFLILVLTIMIGSSFSATVKSTKQTLENCENENLLEDGYFETERRLTDNEISMLEGIRFENTDNGGLNSVTDSDNSANKSLMISPIFYYRVNSFDETAKLLVFDERTRLDTPSVFEGRLPENSDEIAFDRICAREHGLEIGSEVTLSGNSYKICGLVALPDYNSLFSDNRDLVMNTTDFGVTVVSQEGFRRFDQNCITYRYAYRFSDRSLEEAALNDRAEAIAKVLYENMIIPTEFLTSNANQSISFLKLDIGKDGPLMEIFTYILVAVIAFVFAVLTSNTIEAEAPIIGTLRSLGYTKGEIIRHYLTPVLIIGLSASVIGNILGYTVMIDPMYSLYYQTYSVPRIQTLFSVEAFIKTTVVPIVLLPLINILMLRSKLSLSPLKFLRKDLKKGKSQKTRKLAKGSFLHRFRLRVILQNKGSYAILFCGILLSTLLLLFGIGAGPMFDYYTETIADSTPFENQYILKAEYELPESETACEKLELYELDTYYSLAGKDIGITMMGIGENSIFFDSLKLPAEKNKGVITSAMSEKLNLKTGDIITLTHPYSKETYEIEINGIHEYMSSVGIFMNRKNLNEMVGNPSDSFNCYVTDGNPDIPEQYIAKYITRKDLCGAAVQMMKSFDSIIKLINIFSVAIYMILMFILTKAVIEKNALSISYLKVFGYDNREINKIFLTATTITVIISLLIAIPVDALLLKGMMIYITALIEGYITFYVPFWVYALIAGICIAAYYAVNAIHVRHIKKIPMQEALKCRE